MLPITRYSTPGPDGAALDHAHDGTMWRALACLKAEADAGIMANFGDHFPTKPRSQWKEVSFAGYAVPILDQGQHGSCVWHAIASAFWKMWLKGGATPHDFSPTFGYALGNGNRDAGMSISGGADILKHYGNCLASEFPEGHIWKRDIPSAAYQTALRFRARKTFRVTSFDEIGSAIQLGFMPVFDVYVGNGFNNLDADGVPPAWPGVSGNHAQTADGLKYLNGRWRLDAINSWGTAFGMNGRLRYGEAHLDHEIDAFVIQAVEEDPQETNVPAAA